MSGRISIWKRAGLSAIFVAAALMGGCGQQAGQSERFVVGAILSKSGPAASYGSDTDKGAQLAYEEAGKSKLPFSLSYISLDDKTDQTEAVKAAHTLIDVDGAGAILGPTISPSALSAGKYANERGVPMITTTATLDSITEGRGYVFRACFNDSFQGRVLASFVAGNLHKMRAAIIYDKTAPYSVGLAQTFRTEFTARGGTVADMQSYSVTDTDYSALINRVASYDVDVLFIPGWDENVGPMIKQAAGRWNKFTLIGGDGWPTSRLLALAGPNMPQSYALSHFIADDPNRVVQGFVKSYRARYGSDPSPFAALGYDSMRLIVDGARRAGSTDPRAVRDAIERTAGLELATGVFSFDERHNPNKDGIIVSISTNGIRFFQRVKSTK